MALDAKQFAARIGTVDLGLEVPDPSALAKFFGSRGKCGGGEHHKYNADKDFHDATCLGSTSAQNHIRHATHRCRHCEERSDEAIQNRAMDCFAGPVIGRAYARPVGSQ
jgi:hypothetical protein